MVRVWIAASNSTASFRIAGSTCIGDIMELLQRRTGTAVPEQRLICGGRELAPERSLDELNIKTKETLYLLERDPGACIHWAATGTCSNNNCPLRHSHTMVNSPRYVEYMVKLAQNPQAAQAPVPNRRPNRKHALEIVCPHELAAAACQGPASPVPTLVAEMERGDWEPEATFAQRQLHNRSGKTWPILAQIEHSISWSCFTGDRQRTAASALDFGSTASALLMSSEMPVDSDTLKQQANSWEGTPEAREQAYIAWVTSQSKKVRSLAANVPEPTVVAQSTIA
eukprot:TRINITY_DN6195_c0_g1_i13.p1 TRINITY_DN6195_c0_g1~~TRINITY_DN6195_c0_g1_i13.p1  ORF type:complete len:283 (-),score=52.18 TRINITY_DN6195_c0_g1_i13:167-1015(-)